MSNRQPAATWDHFSICWSTHPNIRLHLACLAISFRSHSWLIFVLTPWRNGVIVQWLIIQRFLQLNSNSPNLPHSWASPDGPGDGSCATSLVIAAGEMGAGGEDVRDRCWGIWMSGAGVGMLMTGDIFLFLSRGIVANDAGRDCSHPSVPEGCCGPFFPFTFLAHLGLARGQPLSLVLWDALGWSASMAFEDVPAWEASNCSVLSFRIWMLPWLISATLEESLVQHSALPSYIQSWWRDDAPLALETEWQKALIFIRLLEVYVLKIHQVLLQLTTNVVVVV